MSGQTYSELKPGDLCWIVLDSVNYPEGYLRGKVVEVKPQEGWNQVKAIITDPRQDPQNLKYIHGEDDSYFGREPQGNYSVIPSNKEFDGLVQEITGLEATLEAERTTAKTREQALMEAIAYVRPS